MRSAFWHIFFGVFFLALVFIGTDWLYQSERLSSFVPLGDFFLLALAIFRLTRLSSYDIITDFIRNAFANAPSGSFRATLGALIACPWCAGLWWSLFVVFFYFATPYAWPIILILALAGVATLFQITANLLGWSAELKKRTVLGPEHKSTSTCG